MRTLIRTIAAGAAHLYFLSAGAQGVVTLRILSLPAAKAIAETALAACAARGFHTSVAVVDRDGNLLAMLRDELAHPGTLEMARGKAYTAVLFRTSTLEFQKSTADDPQRAPQRTVPGVLALGGGVPIIFDGEILGAVASSGSSQTTDDECAKAGTASAENLLRAPQAQL